MKMWNGRLKCTIKKFIEMFLLFNLAKPAKSKKRDKTKCVLTNFAEFTGKYLCQSLVFNKVAGLRPTTLLKKRFQYRCFL